MGQLSRFWAGGLCILLAVGILLGAWVRVERRTCERLRRVVAEELATRTLVGRVWQVPDAVTGDARSTPGSGRSNWPQVVLVIGAGDCLTCMAELSRWRRVANGSAGARVLAVIVGAEPDFARRVAAEEGLEFPVLADPDSALPRSLGLTYWRPLRLLVADGRIAIAAAGLDPGPVGFPEGAAALLSASGQAGARPEGVGAGMRPRTDP